MSAEPTFTDWYVEGYVDESSVLQRTPLRPMPFRIGRRLDAELALPFASVSGRHAEICVQDGFLTIRDLGSRNGTFVNGARVTDAATLGEGDIVHVGRHELRVGRPRAEVDPMVTMEMTVDTAQLPRRMVTGTGELRELLAHRAVTPYFQPIARLSDEAVVAHEVLARGAQEGLGTSPYELFRVAAAIHVEAELSRLMRDIGLDVGASLPGGPHLLVNTHPREMDDDRLLESMRAARGRWPGLPVTLEVHEGAVAEPARMRSLRDALADLDVRLAYDDFGAGQARLVELIEVPPDLLKFDISLIRDIHHAPPGKRRLLSSLVNMVRDLGIPCLAEGVEEVEEAEVCRELGFAMAQGWHYGRPVPAEAFHGDENGTGDTADAPGPGSDDPA